MDYEDAKQLKDAGFPQDGVNNFRVYNWDTRESIMIPTLSELIDACGDVVDFSLQRLRDEWWAGSSDIDRISEFEKPSGTGSTPEIAVAKLWLALNGKDSKESHIKATRDSSH